MFDLYITELAMFEVGYDSIAQQGFICIEPSRVCFPTRGSVSPLENLLKTWTNYIEVLLRCLYGNINIDLYFSFPYFTREGAHPPPAHTPFCCQDGRLLQFPPCFPPAKFLGQIKTCSAIFNALHTLSIHYN